MDLTGLQIWTIGHSSRSWEEFLGLLQAHGIRCVADIRRFPGSRKFPHFGADALTRSLPEAGIQYLPTPELGGRRKPRIDSVNDSWRNEAFRAYADYMETDEYQVGRAKLLETARQTPTTMLCSEAVWWRCHRGLISDDLKISGATVTHIFTPTKATEHPFTSAARIVDGRVSYRAEA